MSPFSRELLAVLSISAALFALSARQIRSEILLSRHSQEVQATIVAKESHAWVGYTYVVGGITYEGSAPAPTSRERVNVGDTFTVLFDPTHPDVSGTAKTREVVATNIPFFALATIGGVCIVLVRNSLRRRSVA